MRSIVSGGAGFIGSHLVDRLVENGDYVLVIDNLSTGKEIFINRRASFIKGDIIDRNLVNEIFSDFKPDYLFHLAAQIDVRHSFEDPLFDADVNITGSLNLIEMGRKYNIKRIIFASSGGTVYGEPKIRPISENETTEPVSPYGLSKLIVEKYLNLYKRIHNIDYVSLRLGNVYGPRQNPKGECGVFSIFTMKMLKGERPTIYGDGTATRDYVYISDVIDAFIIASRNESPVGEYNIGTGIELSTRDVFNTIAKMTGYRDEPYYTDPKPCEVYQISLDITKAKKLLNWQPKIGLEEGVKILIDYIRENEI
ncbi:MAG: NAD-dependent epimerase/dehydratase family protein [bacterium]